MRGTRHGNWLQFVPMHNEVTNINTYPISESEIEEERRYRMEERLGIMCGDGVPTDEQLAIAIKEGDEWKENYLKSCGIVTSTPKAQVYLPPFPKST